MRPPKAGGRVIEPRGGEYQPFPTTAAPTRQPRTNPNPNPKRNLTTLTSNAVRGAITGTLSVVCILGQTGNDQNKNQYKTQADR
jgi:hypothetical protein